MATVPSVLGQGGITNSRWYIFPYFSSKIREDLVVEEGTIPSEEVPLPMDPHAWQKTRVDLQ